MKNQRKPRFQTLISPNTCKKQKKTKKPKIIRGISSGPLSPRDSLGILFFLVFFGFLQSDPKYSLPILVVFVFLQCSGPVSKIQQYILQVLLFPILLQRLTFLVGLIQTLPEDVLNILKFPL